MHVELENCILLFIHNLINVCDVHMRGHRRPAARIQEKILRNTSIHFRLIDGAKRKYNVNNL